MIIYGPLDGKSPTIVYVDPKSAVGDPQPPIVAYADDKKLQQKEYSEWREYIPSSPRSRGDLPRTTRKLKMPRD